MRKCSPLIFLLWAVLVLQPVQGLRAEDQTDFIPSFAALGLEQLLAQPVGSVLRKLQPLSRAPSAIYVLTNDDIRRAGVTSLMDALRLVPGLTVLRRNAHTWAITARGFDPDGSAKLLVLVDGRSVYSPLFSGVFWDVQDIPIEIIDRIEVIRGPGAVTWGENAVNGVINILTRTAKDTQGLTLSAGGGSIDRARITGLYGGKMAAETYYRAYAKYYNRNEFQAGPGSGGADDEWQDFHSGFRLDSKLSARENLTVQGDLYKGRDFSRTDLLQSFEPPFTQNLKYGTDLSGGNILTRYRYNFSPASELRLRAIYDRTVRESIVFEEERDTVDLDLSHRIAEFPNHDFVYGINYRVTLDQLGGSPTIQFSDRNRNDQLITAFIQDEYTLVPERWTLIPGSKVGVNDYTGFEFQPAIKALFTPTSTQTWWASIARAVRTPARIDDDLRANVGVVPGANGLSTVVSAFGNRDFESEKLLAYEVGYRTQPSNTLLFDAAVFYHDYDDILSFETKSPFVELDPSPAHTVLPIILENRLSGKSHGIELSSTWRALESLQFKATYSYLHLNFIPDAGSTDTFSDTTERNNPHHQATFRIHSDLPHNFQAGILFYYLDSIPGYSIGSAIRTDVRLAWQADTYTSLELIGQNLFQPPSREYGNDGSRMGPGIFGRVTWRFN